MKIKFGAIVTDGRGKIGGHVASKNRAGAYLRTKVTPTNPNTTAQTTARGILASLSQAWAGLTNAQRLAWNGAVADWSKTDIFGDAKNPTGLNLYVKLNSNISNIGGTLLTVPPLKLSMPQAQAVSAEFDLSLNRLTIQFDDSSANSKVVLIRATPLLSAGVSSVDSQLRVISYQTVTTLNAIDNSGYQLKYGTPVQGGNYFVSVQYVLPNGQKSVPQKLKMTVIDE